MMISSCSYKAHCWLLPTTGKTTTAKVNARKCPDPSDDVSTANLFHWSPYAVSEDGNTRAFFFLSTCGKVYVEKSVNNLDRRVRVQLLIEWSSVLEFNLSNGIIQGHRLFLTCKHFILVVGGL